MTAQSKMFALAVAVLRWNESQICRPFKVSPFAKQHGLALAISEFNADF
jgi:hypothetical protein